MDFRYFKYGILAVFGLYSVSDLLPQHRSASSNIASYWHNVGAIFKKAFDEQAKELQRK